MYRDNTKVINIGNVAIGGGNRVAIQSMTNTRTEDVDATVSQILKLEEAGCDIIRCAVPTMEAAIALSKIKEKIHIPLVADIHFDYKLAIAAIENGADKIRINPGNIGSAEKVKAVVDAAHLSGIANRNGISSIAMSPLFYDNIIDLLIEKNNEYKSWIKSHTTGYSWNIDYYHCGIIETYFDKWIEEEL